MTKKTAFFVYLILLVAAIPWYWGESGNILVLGFPLWAVTSLSVSVIASIFTATLLLRSFVVSSTIDSA